MSTPVMTTPGTTDTPKPAAPPRPRRPRPQLMTVTPAAVERAKTLIEGRGKPTAGIRLLIDPKASLFLIGTEMDYQEEKLKQGFVFKNPNEKGRCGCGESFHV